MISTLLSAHGLRVTRHSSLRTSLQLFLIGLIFAGIATQAEAKKRSAEAAEKPPAEDLLAATDRSRGAAAALEGLTWTADLKTNEAGTSSQIAYEIKARGNDALVKVLSPPRQKGELLLFNDRALWFLKPGLQKPVSISPRQRLMGQAANGDIASTQYARDYDGKIVGEESVNGVAAWKMELKAKAKNVTYDKIIYWVSKADRLAVKAEFLTVSGDVFKSAEFKYGNSIVIAGKSYPFISEMKIQDAVNKENVTVIQYGKAKEASLQKSLFNVNNLAR